MNSLNKFALIVLTLHAWGISLYVIFKVDGGYENVGLLLGRLTVPLILTAWLYQVFRGKPYATDLKESNDENENALTEFFGRDTSLILRVGITLFILIPTFVALAAIVYISFL